MCTSSLRSGDETLSELTGPLYEHNPLAATDDDLTRQHAGEPIGQRIVSSFVLETDSASSH
jgi:protocatechuate 3,4-dioxygenase beta subunit